MLNIMFEKWANWKHCVIFILIISIMNYGEIWISSTISKVSDSQQNLTHSPMPSPLPTMAVSTKNQKDSTHSASPDDDDSTESVPYQYPIIHFHSDTINAAVFNKSIAANSGGKTLMFMHIPKTGGTAMGSIAEQYGVYWVWRLLGSEEGFEYTKIRKICRNSGYNGFDRGMCGGAPWHTPLRWWTEEFMKNYKSSNGKEQSGNVLQWYFDRNNVDWFCLIRNPYHRMISEFKYRTGSKTNCTAKEMNEWIIQNVNDEMAREWDNHMTPQSEYVYDSNGHQIIKHLVRYENMKEELKGLFEEYHLEMVYLDLMNEEVMPPNGHGKECSTSSELNVDNMSDEVKRIIQQRFEEDFEKLGYPM